jgi:hypothetical protein
MKNDGGPAFPIKKWTELVLDESGQIEATIKTKNHPGMSLRDWFAGMAMQGLLTGLNWQPGRVVHSEDELASDAYGFADAMLVEREKEKSKT